MDKKQIYDHFKRISNDSHYEEVHSFNLRTQWYLQPDEADLLRVDGINGKSLSPSFDRRAELINTDAEAIMEDIVSFTFENTFTKQALWFTMGSTGGLKQQQALHQLSLAVFHRLRQTNFYPAIREALKQALIYGLGGVSCHLEDKKYLYRVERASKFVIEEDAFDRIKALYTKESVPVIKASELFDDYHADPEDIQTNKKVELFTAVVPNDEKYVDFHVPKMYKYVLRTIIKSEKDMQELKPQRFKTIPYIFGRCMQEAVHPYGVGLGRKMVPFAAQLNEYLRQINEYSYRSRNPVISKINSNAEEGESYESMFGSIQYADPGLEAHVQIVPYVGDITATLELYTQARQQLRDLVQKQDMDLAKAKDAQVLDRVQNFVNRANYISPYLPLFLKEVIEPIILKEAEYVLRGTDLSLDDFPDLEIAVVSPIFNVASSEKLIQYSQAMGIITQLAQADPTAILQLNAEAAIQDIMMSLGLPQSLRTPQEVDQLRRDLAQQQQQQQGPEAAKMESEAQRNQAQAEQIQQEVEQNE